MRNILIALVMLCSTVVACSRKAPSPDPPVGSQVQVTKQDGVKIVGRLVEVRPEEIVIERERGDREIVKRASISSLVTVALTSPASGEPAADTTNAGAQGDPSAAGGSTFMSPPSASTDASAGGGGRPATVFRELTIPAGTVLSVTLETAVGSDTSQVEDPVRAHLTNPLRINGVAAVPANSVVLGAVTDVKRSAKVKGRASLAFQFHTLKPAGQESYVIRTGPVVRTAKGTKKDDAMKIGIPAAGGAVVGGIIGGKKGAAIGGAAGGGAGTAVVLSTRGEEVRLGPGARLSIKLLAPVTLKVTGKG